MNVSYKESDFIYFDPLHCIEYTWLLTKDETVKTTWNF